MPKPVQKTSVVFFSSNGIGRGHLNRQIAIAIRLRNKKPNLLTMSHALRTGLKWGVPINYFTYHRYTPFDFHTWNKTLESELQLLINLSKATTFVFDFSYIFEGVRWLLLKNPELRSVWIRRGMWPTGSDSHLWPGDQFTHIIEPRDLARVYDEGPTKFSDQNTIIVPPMTLVSPNNRIDRISARNELGLSDKAFVVALDLIGNKDPYFRSIRDKALGLLLSDPKVEVIEFSPVLDKGSITSSGERHHIVELEDAYSYSKAWDCAICRAGYNTFHENLLGAVPTLFIPNNAPERDNQEARAKWAENHSLALAYIIGEEMSVLMHKLSMLKQSTIRKQIIINCLEIAAQPQYQLNGARAVARMIDNDFSSLE